MVSASDEWMADWNKAESFSLRIGAICATMPLYGSWEPNDRIALAVTSFRLVQEHHSSIHLLFQHNKRASGNALARPALEAAFRTAWLAYNANDDEINGIIKGREMPILGELTKALSSKSDPLLNGKHAGLLHSLTHGGSTALGAHYFEGESLDRANAVIIAGAGFSLAIAGSTIAHKLGHEDFTTQLNAAFPES